MPDKEVFILKRLLDELNIKETDFLFIYDKDGRPKSVHFPYHLDQDDTIPESISANLDLFYAYIYKGSDSIH